MTVAELIAELQEESGRLEVIFGGHPIEQARLARGDCDRVIELCPASVDVNGGIVGNPPGDLREDNADKLREYGLSIEGIEPKPCRRCEYIELKRPIPELIDQLNAWAGLKNASLWWHAEVGYHSDEPNVEHEISWDGLDNPNETAARLIRAYENEQRDRKKYAELHAKYGPGGSEEDQHEEGGG